MADSHSTSESVSIPTLLDDLAEEFQQPHSTVARVMALNTYSVIFHNYIEFLLKVISALSALYSTLLSMCGALSRRLPPI